MAVSVVRDAAKLVGRKLGSARAVTTKTTPTDVVTETDLEAERCIREELFRLTPDASILGEEAEPHPGTTDVGWIVDPIDGTVNFLYDLPVVSVSVAATLHGIVVAGAVVDVLRDEVFSAHAGNGAYCNGDPISAANPASLEESLIATGFSYSAPARAVEAQVVDRVIPKARDIRCFGSAALHLCWVANGRLDGYYQYDLKPWDAAAGAHIATEAGATVEEPSPTNRSLMVAAAPSVFAPLRELVTL
jgi:myo-inositol-1(or 4)-monophosphatase